jgi:hypothetical protein
MLGALSTETRGYFTQVGHNVKSDQTSLGKYSGEMLDKRLRVVV